MRLGYILGVSLQTELLVFAFLGIMFTIFDASTSRFETNVHKVWEMKMDPKEFSENIQLYMRYLLTALVSVRTFSVYIYLGGYLILLYPLIAEERPCLILPWLFVNMFNCFVTGPISLYASFYTCLVYKFMKPACWDFLVTHFLVHAPSVYMLCLVWAFYNDLKKFAKVKRYLDPELKSCRNRFNNSREEDELINKSSEIQQGSGVTVKDEIEKSLLNITNGHLRTKISRSLDSLLETIKRRTKGEDTVSSLMCPLNGLTLQERAAKLVKLSQKDISEEEIESTEKELLMVRNKLKEFDQELDLCKEDESSLISEEIDGQTSVHSKIEQVVDYITTTTATTGDQRVTMKERTRDTCLQAECPDLDLMVNDFIARKSAAGHSRKKSSLTEPKQIRESFSPVGPNNMEGLDLRQVFKNPAANIRYYKDDGYTQALLEKIKRKSLIPDE